MPTNALLANTVSDLAPMIQSGEVSPRRGRPRRRRAGRAPPAPAQGLHHPTRRRRPPGGPPERERAIAAGGYRGPLDGVPVGLKDNIATGRRPNHHRLQGLRRLRPPATTLTSWKRLKSAGAIILGKENLHEFAGGVPCDNPYYGSVSNPWNTGPRRRRLQRRQRRERRRLRHLRLPRHRPRRLRAHPLRHVRHRRHEADLWARQPARASRHQLQRRPHSPHDP